MTPELWARWLAAAAECNVVALKHYGVRARFQSVPPAVAERWPAPWRAEIKGAGHAGRTITAHGETAEAAMVDALDRLDGGELHR